MNTTGIYNNLVRLQIVECKNLLISYASYKLLLHLYLQFIENPTIPI